MKKNKFKDSIYKIIRIFKFRRMWKGIRIIKEKGISGFFNRLSAIFRQDDFESYYPKWFLINKPGENDLEIQRKSRFDYEPKISIIVPAYKTPEKFLVQMVESVIKQTYSNWELCIADGSGGDSNIECLLNKYLISDKRIKVSILDSNEGISGNTNAAIELSTGEFIGFLDHDDVLAPNALHEVVKIVQDRKVDFIYTDEDMVTIDLSKHVSPNFKPDFSIDLLRSHNYITHFLVIKNELLNNVGKLNSEYDGAQDYDFVFRCSEKAGKIVHIPKILYHWRLSEGSTSENPESKLYAYDAGKRALEAHLKRSGIDAEVIKTDNWGVYHVKYSLKNEPVISIIIPNKDNVNYLERCITSLVEKSVYRNFEIVIVENNSTDEETFIYYENIKQQHDFIKVVIWEKEFNYSSINNFGVENSKGEYLLFLNNDTELISVNGLIEMLGCCMRKEVGIVGAKLFFEDDTIQHAGVVIGIGGFAGHVFSGLERNNNGYMFRAGMTCNYSAVTAACLMTSREIFNEVNGFNEIFAIALNDIDFCLKVRNKNYLVVYNPYSEWYHFESKSRGYEDTAEKKARFDSEVEKFKSEWNKVIGIGDPYYNINFNIFSTPYTLK